MPTFLSVDKIKAAWGSYYRPDSLGVADLKKQIMQSNDTQAYFPLQSTDETQVRGANMKLTNVTQPFYSRFSHLGTFDFVPYTWSLERVKINIEMTPDDLAATAIDFLAPKGLYKADAPIVKTIADYVLAKHKEDNENDIIFKGVRKEVSSSDQTNRVAGATVDSRTGIRHKIRLFNAAGKFAVNDTVIAMGAVPTDPVLFVTYMETMYYAIPELYRKFIMEMFMSTTLRQRYRTGMRAKYNMYHAQVADLDKIIDTNCMIVGLPSMLSSDLIWCTIDGNRRGKIKNSSNSGVFNIEIYDTYNVRLSTDWYQGEDFYTPELIWTNGRDLTLPA